MLDIVIDSCHCLYGIGIKLNRIKLNRTISDTHVAAPQTDGILKQNNWPVRP